MRILKTVRDLLHEPRLRHVDVDSDRLLVVHQTILQEKPMMRDVFQEFYDLCVNLDQKLFSGEGKQVEIGAGVSFFKRCYPGIISTDVKKADNLDMVLDAQNMDLPDRSARAFYGLNCFHHFPEPCKFFDELMRVLVPGGGCVLIEPYFGPVASRFYQAVHDVETFNATQQEWENVSLGFSSNANQALSYIVFVRDRQKFDALYPGLEIVCQRPIHNYLRYLFSGGLNFRQVLPNFLSPMVRWIEVALVPLGRWLALHHVIVIRKRWQARADQGVGSHDRPPLRQ